MEKYGMVALAQTIIQYFSVVINFGLDISAVKDVSVHRSDKLALNRIVSTVLFIKLLLFLLCSFVLLIGMLTVPFMEQNKPLIFLHF